jgi:hypothetical protein
VDLEFAFVGEIVPAVERQLPLGHAIRDCRSTDACGKKFARTRALRNLTSRSLPVCGDGAARTD